MSHETMKPTNPKDVLGTNKIELGLVSDYAIAEEALAMTEGMFKYGRFNYRGEGVRASVYIAAARRHLAKYWNGEDHDPKTGVHHLGSARACLGVLFDSLSMGNMKDDRPPKNPRLIALLDAMEPRVKQLREAHADKTPKHWTIADTPDLVDPKPATGLNISTFGFGIPLPAIDFADYGDECCQSPGCEHAQEIQARIENLDAWAADMGAPAYAPQEEKK